MLLIPKSIIISIAKRQEKWKNKTKVPKKLKKIRFTCTKSVFFFSAPFFGTAVGWRKRFFFSADWNQCDDLRSADHMVYSYGILSFNQIHMHGQWRGSNYAGTPAQCWYFLNCFKFDFFRSKYIFSILFWIFISDFFLEI